MALTRAEENIIQFIEKNIQDVPPTAEFLKELNVLAMSGSKSPEADGRINWGSASFSKIFKDKFIDTSLITEPAISVMCHALLDNKTFDQAPLRQVHLFSHLYGELLKRHVEDLKREDFQVPVNWHELHRKILQVNIEIFNSKKAGTEATYDCINNFLYMRFPELNIKDAKQQEAIQKSFFEDIKLCTIEKSFISKPNTPLPQRKPPHTPAPEKKAAPQKKSQQADRGLTDKLRKQYKSTSSPMLFGGEKAHKPGKSQSAGGKLESTSDPKLKK